MTRVGILGAGQLGRLLALAGYPLGLRFRFLDPAPDAPARDIAEHHCATYDEADWNGFADGLDVVTYEFENVPVATVQRLSEKLPVFPGAAALAAMQDRLAEKAFLGSLGIPTADFIRVDEAHVLPDALRTVGLPAVLKRTRLGYDGTGQRVLDAEGSALQAFADLAPGPFILERLVRFDRELSLIAVRGRDGSMRFYPLVENYHAGGILRWSQAPAPASEHLQAAAEGYARRIFDRLDYVGVLTIELFEVAGQLLVNELAPRVHNSGHWTIEGAETSQFENHLRAILGLPLGSTAPLGVSMLFNLIGKVPDTREILDCRDTHLHLYGKRPRPGRKLGHVTVRAADPSELVERVRRVRPLLAAIDSATSPVVR